MKMGTTTRRRARRNAYGEPIGFRKQRLAYLVIRYDLDDPNQLPVRTSFNNKADVIRAAKAEHKRTGHPVEAWDPNTRKVLWTSGRVPNPRRPTYLSEMVKRQKADEKRHAKELKARTQHGVFLWRGDGRYQEEDAVRVFKSESAAEKYAKGLNATYMGAEGGYVVRSLVRQRNPRKVVRVKESDHVTVNVNPRRKKPSDKLRDMERPEVLGYELDRETLTPKRGYIDTSRPGDYGADPIGDGMFRMVPSGDIVDYEERNRRLKKNPNVGREPNGPHIVGTTAYQVGVQEGERGTRKSKPTNVQIKDAIEAAYPQYKRMLQPSYVRKLASVYTRQWKAGVKDGKATKRANKGKRRGNPETYGPELFYDLAEAVGVPNEWIVIDKHQDGMVWFHVQRGDVRQSDWWAKTTRGGKRMKAKSLRKDNPRRSNPESSTMTDADRLYEKFHGKGPTQTTEVRTVISSRDNLAELGQLCELDVHLMTDEKVKLKFPSSGRNVVMLASSPDGRQLYFEGGNQTVDLRQLGMSGRDWVRDHMALGVLMVVTYRTEKGFDKFELIDYFHKLGEVTGQKPVLTYDTINHLLSVVGGQYEVRPEGIVN